MKTATGTYAALLFVKYSFAVTLGLAVSKLECFGSAFSMQTAAAYGVVYAFLLVFAFLLVGNSLGRKQRNLATVFAFTVAVLFTIGEFIVAGNTDSVPLSKTLNLRDSYSTYAPGALRLRLKAEADKLYTVFWAMLLANIVLNIAIPIILRIKMSKKPVRNVSMRTLESQPSSAFVPQSSYQPRQISQSNNAPMGNAPMGNAPYGGAMPPSYTPNK